MQEGDQSTTTLEFIFIGAAMPSIQLISSDNLYAPRMKIRSIARSA